MKRLITMIVTMALLACMPTVAFARGYSGGRSYHSSFSSHSGFSSERSYSSTPSYSLPKTSGQTTGTYRSGAKSYSGGSTYRSSGTTTRTTTTSRTTRSTFGGSYGYGSHGYGYYPGHFGSFFSGFFLGSLFHPFGWGFGGGYYGGGPGYYTTGGWGGPGYSPFWSIIGIIVDIIIFVIVLRLMIVIVRAFARRPRRSRQTMYAQPNFGRGTGPMYDDDAYETETVERHETVEVLHTQASLDEQAVCDACCEYVSRSHRCAQSDVTVDLIYEPSGEFGAEIWVRGTAVSSLSQYELTRAVAEFVANKELVSTNSVQVELKFTPGLGVHAQAEVQ